jgi:hypothetical protein
METTTQKNKNDEATRRRDDERRGWTGIAGLAASGGSLVHPNSRKMISISDIRGVLSPRFQGAGKTQTLSPGCFGLLALKSFAKFFATAFRIRPDSSGFESL